MAEEVVLYIGGFELPDKNAAAHRVISNAKILKKNGIKVVFVGIDKSLKNDSKVLSTHSIVQGFDSFSVPYPNDVNTWINYLTNIDDYIEICNLFGNVKAIIMYNFQAKAMKKIIKYCRCNDILCWSDVTEWRSSKGERLTYRIIKNFDTWYRMRILHKKMDGLIVISRYLENYYKKVKNVFYIPPLTDISEEKWRNSFDKSTDELKLVYAGSPERKDRLDILIESLNKVSRNYRLDIIGITKDQFLKYYPKYVEILEKNNNIIFHGRLSHLESLNYVKKANYSCFFRENNRVSKAGFPTKFAESITCGTPVITNDSSDLIKYANGSFNGYILKNTDSDEIASIIEHVDYTMPIKSDLFDFNYYNITL